MKLWRVELLAPLLALTGQMHGFQLPADAYANYARAEALVRSRQWELGLALLAPLEKQYPGNTRILNLTGLALTGEGKIEEADAYFGRTLEASPGFFAALKNLGINEVGLRRAADAEAHLAQALALAPGDPVIHLYLGRAAFDRREYARATDMFRGSGELVFRDPNLCAQLAVSDLESGSAADGTALLDQLSPERLNPPTQFMLAVALMHTSLPARAIPYLEALRGTNGGSAEIAYDLALAYLDAKQYRQAIDTLKDLIARGPETSELNNLLSEAYEGDRQTQPAVDALRRAIALDPKDEDNYLDFASLCINHRSYDDGLKVLNVGLQMDPNSERLVFEKGILYAAQNHFDMAEGEFERASAMAPDRNIGALGLGAAYLQTGNTKDAVLLLRRRLSQSPEDARLLCLLGDALVRAGAAPGDAGYTEAQQSLEHAVRLEPQLAQAHLLLGKVYLAENRNADAVAQLEQARKLDPGQRSSYSHLAIAYRKLGDSDKAKEALDTLRDLNSRDRGESTARVKENVAP